MGDVIQVWMNQSIEKIQGRRWPYGRDGAPLGMTAVEQFTTVVVQLPSGRALQFNSKHTILQQERGVVTLVSVLPLNEAVEFATAISRATEITRRQGITDPKFHETILHWGDAPPEIGSFAPKYIARTAVDPSVNLYVNVRPTDEDGWYVAVELQQAVGAREHGAGR